MASARSSTPSVLIATARSGAHERIEAALGDQLTTPRRAQLDALLIAPPGLAELEADQRAQLRRLQAAIDAGAGVRLQPAASSSTPWPLRHWTPAPSV